MNETRERVGELKREGKSFVQREELMRWKERGAV